MTAREFRNTPQVHYSNLRLFINAGLSIPECKASAALLDTDSGRWEQTRIRQRVTCKHCLRAMKGGAV